MSIRKMTVGSRRDFLRNAASAGALAVAGSLAACARSGLARLDTLPQKLRVFDLHSHLMVTRHGKMIASRKPALAAQALAGAFFSVVPDMNAIGRGPTGPAPARGLEEGEAWQVYQDQLAAMRVQAEDLPIRWTTDHDSLGLASDEHVQAYLAVEGAHLLEGKIERMEKIYADGVRSLQLVHYVPNDLGDDQTSDARFGGLSGFGREVVQEANRLGILIDLAHADHKTSEDVVKLSSKPVIVSHSSLKNPDGSEALQKRNLTLEHAKMITDAGGVIGVWPAARSRQEYEDAYAGRPVSFDAVHGLFARHVELLGADHIALGSDFGGGPVILTDYAQLDDFTSGLTSAAGLSPRDAQKVASGNAWRVIDAALG